MAYYHYEELKRFLTVKETARELNVSDDTVYRLIAEGEITAKKISKRKTVISADEVNRFIEKK